MSHVERDAYAAVILLAWMKYADLDPAPVWDDVASFNGKPWRGALDIFTAVYPRQPFSVAVELLRAAEHHSAASSSASLAG